MSLGRRLIIGSVLCTTAAVALAGVLAWIAARSTLLTSVDTGLRERRTHMVDRGIYLHQRNNGLHAPPPPPGPGYFRGRPLFQIIAPDGIENMRSSSLDVGVSLADLVPDDGCITDVDIGDGRSARALRFSLPVRNRTWPRPPESDGDRDRGRDRDAADGKDKEPAAQATAIIATDTTELDIELRRLAWILGSVGSAATLLAVALAFWLRRAVLTPVARIAAGIVAIAPADPTARVPTGGVPAELGQIVDRLNELLDRLHATLGREKATLAAIAHELRTPVAGLRATLEFARRRDDGARAAQTYAACHEVVVGMQAMTDHLLMLARIESGQLPVDRGPVEAVAVVRAAWDAVAERAAARPLSVAVRLPDAATVAMGDAWLRLVAGNLFDNLISHAPAGAEALITLERQGGTWHLTVDNPHHGHAIDPEDAVRPFWRGDSARSAGTHCGLGLALCQRAVRLAGGELVVAAGDGRFRITAVLPAG